MAAIEADAIGAPALPRARHVAAVAARSALTFSFFATQIGRTFFPSSDPSASPLASLATFAGFLMRPLGAWVIGQRLALLALLATALAASTARAEVVCTAVADARTGKVLLQHGDCGRRVAPMSTFKIAISLMGFDSGVLVDEHAPALPFKPGYPDWNPSWRTTTDPTSWIANSVVWYSQQVTTRLGQARFARYVRAFGYGNRDISGDRGKSNGLTRSWLASSLQISPLEQLAFLERVAGRRLPVSAHAYAMTDAITYVATLPDGWRVNGKSGSGPSQASDGSPDHKRELGWFVGWARKGDRTLVFARLEEQSAEPADNAGRRAKAAFLEQASKLLGAL